MNRRELLKMSAVSLAVSSMPPSTRALAQTASSANVTRATEGGFQLDVYSRSLQWLRTPQELGKAVNDIGLHSVDLTVMPYPGHVDPAKVKTDLPAFVSGLKESGVSVRAITTPIVDADSPNVESILDAASSQGIRFYNWSGLRYDEKRPYSEQLDALKPRIAKLVKCNEKYRMKALYQPKAGAGNIGAAFFDLLDVLRNFDPQYVAFRYDTGNLLQATPDTMVTQIRLGAPYIGAVALNDASIKLDLPEWDQGPYTDNPLLLNEGDGGGDNTGNGGHTEAIGGGGRPMPYRVTPVPAGMGVIDLPTVGRTLKEINFSGPAECQTEWPLGGAESGNDKTNFPRQRVIAGLKHNRLMVEAAFASSWNIEIALPPFMKRTNGKPPAGSPTGGPKAQPSGKF
jgi:sugar phosphate isomerase/epimerase